MSAALLAAVLHTAATALPSGVHGSSLQASPGAVHDANHRARLVLPTFLSSSMALQRKPEQARLWGWSAPTSAVSVALDDTTTVDTQALDSELLE